MKKFLSYLFLILLPLSVGGLSSLLTMKNMNIYSEIIAPPLSPPGILFPIVWTVLYILMGISSAIIYNSNSPKKDDALFIYGASLILNFFWSIFFFNLRNFVFSFIILLALLFLIILTVIKYYKINKLASFLQIPYVLWVAFAGYLNFFIILLN
ncbi:MAG: tryptophan-rich sensory protein [Clostridiales bacterium]|nr:tryptophan-rich sensory protein [Clostridiales bacterium]